MIARTRGGVRAAVLALVLLAAVAGAIGAPDRAEAAGPTVVSLTFDDGIDEQYAARSILGAEGLKATFFVNSARIGSTGFMSLDQLRDLQADGHEIGGHTLHHAQLTDLAPEDQRGEICDDRSALVAAGFDVRSLAYPFGAADSSAAVIAADCGYTSARDIGGLAGGPTCRLCPLAESLPPRDPYLTRAAPSVHPGTTLAMLQGYVTRAQANGGGWVNIVMHHICDGCAVNAMAPGLLGDFARWLGAQHGAGVDVRTVADAMQTAAPSAPPNLLANASLENDEDVDGAADCWTHIARGANAATTQRTPQAHTGMAAEQIDITEYTEGARKLISSPDVGCAPSATPGQHYELGAWYHATGNARFVVYYRTALGHWAWWAQSPQLATADGWTRATWTTPPLPPGATHVAAGLELPAVGSLVVDDVSLAVADAPAAQIAPPPIAAP